MFNKFFKITFFLTLSFCSTFSFAESSDLDIRFIISKNFGSYSSIALPMGFSDKPLEISTFPLTEPEVQKTLAQLENKSRLMWENYVEDQWALFAQGEYAEFEFSDETSRDDFKANPHKYLGLSAKESLNPIEDIHAIYKDEKLIGYALELFNSIRGQIIQDGSGYVIYLNSDYKVIEITDWDS